MAGIIGIALDRWIDGDRGAALEELVEKVMLRVMARLAPALRDSVIQAFADNIDNLSVIATDEFLDQLARNALTLCLGDRDFAEDIYAEVRDQAILGSTERWRDTTISMNLSPLSMNGGRAASSQPPLFVLTARHQYTVVPAHAVRRFSAVSNEKHYEELLDDSTSTSIWHINPKIGIDAGSREAFELVQFSVYGEERSIRRTGKSGSQTYSVNLGPDAVRDRAPVTIAYTYRTVVRQYGHMLHVETEQPTKGLDVTFEYGDCGIAEMRLIPFISSSKKVRNYRMPESVPEQSVGIGFDGWCTTGQGVTPKVPSRPVSISSLHRLLINPYCVGIVAYKGVYHQGTHEALVDMDTWLQVQDVMPAHNTAGEKDRIHNSYLRGTNLVQPLRDANGLLEESRKERQLVRVLLHGTKGQK